MALNLNDKKNIVENLHSIVNEAPSAIVADSRGVEANDLNNLRKRSREAGVYIKVVRNSLAIKAFNGTEHSVLSDHFVGPSILGIAQDHPGAAARLFIDFAKQQDNFKIKAASFEGKIVDADFLSKLPTFDEAVAKFAFLMKEISMAKFCRLMSALKDCK